MTRTDRLLARVRARLALLGALEDLQTGLAGAAGVVLLAVLGRASGLFVLAWPTALAVALAALAIAPLVGLIVRRRSRASLAAVADQKLVLAERVSTALWVASDTAAAGPFADEVCRDAEERAAAVESRQIREAFRPRAARRPLIAAAVLAACAGALLFVGPGEASVVESPEARTARLEDENRIADVARRMAEAARRVEDAAKERTEDELAKLAAQVAQETRKLAAAPPPKPQALQKLNEMAEQARAAARKRAGLATPASEAEAREGSKQLADLLRKMADSGLESIQKDLKDLAERLDAGDKGENGPTTDELRKMADRLDALSRAMQSADAAGMKDLREKLRSIGNEDLLQKIAERMREMASRLDAGEDYESLESPDMEDLDLSELSREELEELLRQLDELAGMEDLADMLRRGGGEMSGGRRLRLPGGPGAGT